MTSSLFSLALMAPTDGSSSGMVIFVGQIGLLIAIFYFLIIRPQSQARKKHAELLAGLKKGDEIVTAGGLIGKVKEMKENRITMETGSSLVVVERSKIVQIGDAVSPTAQS